MKLTMGQLMIVMDTIRDTLKISDSIGLFHHSKKLRRGLLQLMYDEMNKIQVEVKSDIDEE